MKKTLQLFVVFMLTSLAGYSQLAGTKSIPGDYSSVAAAIADLNSQGVGSGGVTFNIQANHTETFPTVSSGLINVSGTSTDPVIFKKSGTGANPLITAAPGTSSASEYIFCISGGDYITFDSINITDPSGTIEWGFALLKKSATDGVQHNTIKNCSVTLSKTNISTIGIYTANVTLASPTTQLSVNTSTGTNRDNKFFGNTIQNAYNGIYVSGFADATSPYLFYDQNNEIGVDGANFISNFGGGSGANNGIFAAYQNNLKIAGNTVNGPSAGSGVCYGIQVGTCNNANLDIYNNYVSIVYNGTGQFYGIYDNHGNVFSGATLSKFYGNNVSNCTFPNPAKTNCQYIFINGGAANCQCYNNLVSNNNYGSTSAVATGQLIGIYHNGNQNISGSLSYHDNQVTNITRTQSVVGAGATYYQYVNGGMTYVEMYNNLVDNCNVASNGDCIGFRGLNSAVGTKLLYNNTVTNLYNANGKLEGISTSNSTGTWLYNNKVMNLTTLGSIGTAVGINLSTLLPPGGNLYCYNNFIAGLYTPASIYPYAIYGIQGNGSQVQTLGIYNNSIYLNATSTGANFGSYGIYLSYLPVTIDLKNNICINTSVANGTGITAALGYFDYRYSNYSTTSNNNDFYAGAPGPQNLIFYAGPNQDPTLAQFQSRVYPAETNSITEFPPFISTSPAAFDLHINPGIQTQVESGGVIISTPDIATDFDLDPRFPNEGYPVNPGFAPFAPDMGADEFAGLYRDTKPPLIAYTPLENTPSHSARTLISTITDLSGVPASGTGLPRMIWKKNIDGTWNSDTAIFMGGDQYNFTFAPDRKEADTIYYYVIAQDNASPVNVGTSPSQGASGFSVNPPSASVPPSNPNFYIIIPTGIADTTTVQNITLTTGTDTCFNGANLVSTAGNGTTFAVQSGSSVTLIAGQSILCHPGTTVASGSYLHGYITLTNDFCYNPQNPLVTNEDNALKLDELQPETVSSDLIVFPNPTPGSVIVRLNKNLVSPDTRIEIFTLDLQRIGKFGNIHSTDLKIDLTQYPSGIYCFRLTNNQNVWFRNVIKL